MSKIIGNENNEDIDSISFKNNMNNDKPGYHNIKCPTTIKNNGKKELLKYELSELKSSLLIQNLVNDLSTNQQLAMFMKKILKSIYMDDYDYILSKYALLITTSIHKDNVDNYPVSQLHKFDGFPNDIEKDFIVMYNFMKYTWLLLYNEDGDYKCSMYMLNIEILINVIQQHLTQFTELVKGKRKNLKDNITNDQVGITNIQSSYLKRKVISLSESDTNIKEWIHPGRVQCRVPYYGKYGKLIKEYRINNKYEASLQCGISGSVNFCIYMYLYSLTISNITSNTDDDIINIILSSLIVLLADGGHNIREVILGITLSAIILKLILDTLKEELILEYGNNFNLTKDYNVIEEPNIDSKLLCLIWDELSHYTNKMPQLDSFKSIINSFGKWEYSINYLYDTTKNINPLGISETDLNNYNSDILNYFKKTYMENDYKIKLFDILFDKTNIKTKEEQSNIAVIIASLDSDRYLLDEKTFKEGPEKLLNKLILQLKNGKQIIDKTNNQLNDIINNCDNIDKKSDPNSDKYNNIINNTIPIPLAFISKNNRLKKSLKKSLKRSLIKKSSRKSRNLRKKSNRKNRSLRKKSTRKSRSLRKKSSRKNRSLRKKSTRKSRSLRKKSSRKNRSLRKKSNRKNRSLRKKSNMKNRSLRKKSNRKNRSLR
jgi:hypothetical protein